MSFPVVSIYVFIYEKQLHGNESKIKNNRKSRTFQVLQVQ